MCAALTVRGRATLDDINRNMIAATGCVAGRSGQVSLHFRQAPAARAWIRMSLCYILLTFRRERHRDCAMYAGRPNGRDELTLPDSAGPPRAPAPAESSLFVTTAGSA